MRDSVTERVDAEVAARRLEADPAQHEAARRLDALAAALHSRPAAKLLRLRTTRSAPRGLYLWGGVGRGKTLLMDLFFAALGDIRGGAERHHFYRFMRDVHAGLRAAGQRENPLDLVAEHTAGRTRVICLDEFLVADIADAMILAGLFAGLFKRGVTLVTTSNVPPRELYRDGLQRQRFLPAIDLISAHVEVIHLDRGIDYRLRHLERAPTYIDSARDDADAELTRRFAALAGGAARGPADLGIEGRVLHATSIGPGIVWFEFGELCDGPRGQGDYIELARFHHTIVISRIPRFDGSNDDAARRFIMLIDELYDRGVKLVVSAAAPPPQLYHGERLQFDFERTASRLMEMQTQRYLAGEHRP